ncbi:hypothetical protein A6R68_03677, partial [Neotoma lepida]
MLLLVSNLFLWEHVTSKPTGSVSSEDLYHRAVQQSHTTYGLAADIYQEFDLKFFRRSWFRTRIPSVCHTASIHTPESREEVHETKSQIEVEENAYPAWSGLADLQSSDEDTHLFAFYSLVRCLKRDTHKIDTYLKVLRCRVVFNN